MADTLLTFYTAIPYKLGSETRGLRKPRYIRGVTSIYAAVGDTAFT
jgi:hypothetical protein